MDKKQLDQAQKAKSAEELSQMARKNGIALTDSTAEEIYAKLHASEGSLSDEELSNVTGGGCSYSATLREKYVEVLWDSCCPDFVWSYWIPSSNRASDRRMCFNCHHVITSKDEHGHTFVRPYCFCELRPK